MARCSVNEDRLTLGQCTGGWQGLLGYTGLGVMAAVAQGLILRGLAATEEHFLGLSSLILHRGEAGVFMGAIAKRLVRALAAGAPPVAFSGFSLYGKGRIGGAVLGRSLGIPYVKGRSGTWGRTRTDTVLLPPEFESSASTNFATQAFGGRKGTLANAPYRVKLCQRPSPVG